MASGATVTAVDGTQDSTIRTTAGVYHGFSVRNTSASVAAVLRIRRNSASGDILDTISLAASESRAEWYGDGIACPTGIFEDWVSGAYEGTIRHGEA